MFRSPATVVRGHPVVTARCTLSRSRARRRSCTTGAAPVVHDVARLRRNDVRYRFVLDLSDLD
ncbi:MAG TPA: hypothetical protein VD903_05355 [Pseudonocardia sp.]|nr:hypothetical protein [Pseudonocardia sp.]